MATEDTINFQALLEPIPGESPAGVDLRDDESPTSYFIQLKTAQKDARSVEDRIRKKELMDRLAVGNEEMAAADHRFSEKIEPPNWELVYELATDSLANKSKDMWVATWLLDALTRLHGFAGLRDGFRLVRELAEKFWENIHPAPDTRGYGRTFSQLAGLANGALAIPIAEIPITGKSGDRSCNSSDYVDAMELDNITDAKQRDQQIERGTLSLDMIREAVRETPPEFFVTLIADLDQAIEEHGKMSQFLNDHCGKDPDGVSAAPPSSKIRNSLEECRGHIMDLAGTIIEEALATEETADQTDGGGGAQGAAAALVPGNTQSRQQAFKTLHELAKFFRKTEPLSPVSFELQKIVRWGDMEFPDLMKELISKPDALEDLFRQTGVNSASDASEENQ